MQRSREANYYRIGVFVIIGLTLLIIALLILGSGLLFKRTVYVETYFNDTIQGLAEGFPVKYRGLDIGHVKKLGFVNHVYDIHTPEAQKSHKQYIYCKMAITPDFLVGKDTEDVGAVIAKDIKQGLRVKLALQGLTGNAYLEIDFLNPKANPPLPVNWKPKNYYIPSTTSTLTKFSDNVQYILEELKKVKINKLFDDLDDLFVSTDSTMKRVDSILMRSNQSVLNILTNFNSITENLRVVTENAKAYPSSFVFSNPPQPLDLNKL